jgi:energy-coupling factor transporter ATP-binding protein EcfA2
VTSLSFAGRPSRQALVNVFTPNDPISDAARFAGRGSQLDEITDALLTRGADLIIFGERGCGKSSLARMLHSISTGEYQVLDYYGLRENLERKGRIPGLKVTAPWGTQRTAFTTIWVHGFGKSFQEVIHTALTRRKDDRFGPGLLAYLPTEADQFEVASKIRFNKVFTGEASVKEVIVPAKPLNIKDGFELATQRYAAEYPDRELLIIVDEFETVTDRTDIAQYLKSANARFALVGVASTTVELLPEHASVARDTHAVEVPAMTETELRSIVEIGNYVLSGYVTYTDAAVQAIAEVSSGSPYWCHYLARGLLLDKIEAAGSWDNFVDSPREVREVTADDVQALVAVLPNRADSRIYEEALRLTTMGDPISEKVLRSLATSSEAFVSSHSVVSDLSEKGIDREDTLETIEGFLNLEGSPLEEHGRVRDIVRLTFRDPNFKRYVLLRGVGTSTSRVIWARLHGRSTLAFRAR